MRVLKVMRILIALLALLSCTLAIDEFHSVLYSRLKPTTSNKPNLSLLNLQHVKNSIWFNFKLQYSKNYEARDDEKRQEIFIHNLKKILKHNEEYSQGKQEYELDVNK